MIFLQPKKEKRHHPIKILTRTLKSILELYYRRVINLKEYVDL
jgi:hypothetical protein